MKKLLKTSQKGFTLIELLVVIGILGILAAALVATIDPFEQLKKAQDANTKNVLVEFANANLRYYTTHNQFPWDDTTNYVVCSASVPDQAALDSDQMKNCILALTDEKELKLAFSSATQQLKEIYVTYAASTNELIACFKPQSKSQQNDDELVKYNRDGTENLANKDCSVTGANEATSGCYWCTR